MAAIQIPAAGLIATGLCTGSCLLALDGECECRCGGRFHGALTEAPVPVEPHWHPAPPPEQAEEEAEEARTILSDVLAVLGDDAERIHSDVLCGRLGQRWPGDYPGWTAGVLAQALLAVGLRTRQTWAERPDGSSTNRQGLHRRDILDAMHRAPRAAAS